MSIASARIYLDNNATTAVCAEAQAAMLETLALYGNPASIHHEGRKAKALLERARGDVAALLRVDPAATIFTSGGTEANWLGVQGLAQRIEAEGRPRVVAHAATDHPSVRSVVRHLLARGWTLVPLEVSPDGVVRLTDTPVSLVVLTHVNHEVGTVQPLAALTAHARNHGALVHVDAVQAAGKVALSDATQHADSVAITAHKLHGPKGVGALWAGPACMLPLAGIEGGQEKGRRPGTEPVMLCAGFGAAARRALHSTSRWFEIAALGAQLEAGLRALPGCVVHGDTAARVGGTVNVRFEGVRGASVVMALDLQGVAVSTGAACNSGSLKASQVLLGMGLFEAEALGAVRFSAGWGATPEEIDRVLAMLPAILERARRARA